MAVSFVEDLRGKRRITNRGMEKRVYLRSLRSREGQGATVRLFSILDSLIIVTIETVAEKELQFNRVILRHYSLFTPDFKQGETKTVTV